ncbi:MAG: hypothetical protein ACI4OC_01485 [Coriobacteriales bacterium]
MRVKGVAFTGLDYDDDFVRVDAPKAAALDDGNSYRFVQGDSAATTC